jgi:hypothetical protein
MMMATQSTMHVCLVCHTETDVWDGGFRSIDTLLPTFLDTIAGVRDSTGAAPRVAWCLTSQVAEHRPEPFRELLSAGHEIGVHSHFPGAIGVLEHDQDLNARNLDRFAVWFPQLCSRIADAGFPRPRTHVTWMFAYRDSFTRVLADAGIRAECSVCHGGTHFLANGFLLADSRRRRSGKPYRLAEDDHCAEGSSPVVELPVSGGFDDYWEPGEKGEFQFHFFNPTKSEPDLERQCGMFRERLGTLAPGEVDILHIHFHLYGFLPPDETGEERLRRAQRLLANLAQDERVRFSTPLQAVREWEQSLHGRTDELR